MVKIFIANDAIKDLMERFNIENYCDEDLNVCLTEEEYKRLREIVEMHAPAAEHDYGIID